MGSSQRGPSRVPHWKPWTMESFTVLSRLLLTSDGSVSSTRMLGPVESGPKAQMDRAASKSQSYLLWKNSLNFFLHQTSKGHGRLVFPNLRPIHLELQQRIFLLVPADLNDAVLNVFGQAFLQRLGDHRDFVLFVGRFGETFQRRRFDDRFAKRHDRIGNCDVNDYQIVTKSVRNKRPKTTSHL